MVELPVRCTIQAANICPIETWYNKVQPRDYKK